jgi:NADH:ubiquinone oxidoreductase subunit
MTIGMRLYSWLRGEAVGSDSFGNRYYRSRRLRRDDGRRERRWVVYGGEVEASAVPPEWHAWLHYLVDDAPTPERIVVRAWEKEHVPNLTGTASAYRPPGHDFKGGQRARATGDYEPWTPR